MDDDSVSGNVNKTFSLAEAGDFAYSPRPAETADSRERGTG